MLMRPHKEQVKSITVVSTVVGLLALIFRCTFRSLVEKEIFKIQAELRVDTLVKIREENLREFIRHTE